MRPRPPLVPLYGFVEGDTMGVVVLAQPEEPMTDLAARLAEAAAVRVAPGHEGAIRYDGRILDSRATLRSAGIQPLERVDLIWKAAPARTPA